MNKMIVIIFLGSVLKTLGSGTPGGWVIGWGDNVAGEATGICPFVVSTNQDIMLKQYKDMSLRTSLGAMVAVNSQPLTNIIAISAGASHCLALKGDYTVVAWGWNGGGKTVIPTGLTNVVALSAGNMHSLALRQDGTVVGWGQSGNAALNIPAGLNKMVAVATACGDNSLALKNDGTVLRDKSSRTSAGPETRWYCGRVCLDNAIGSFTDSGRIDGCRGHRHRPSS